MNGIYAGTNKATKIYAGDKEVTKIYKGTELVYESTPPAMPVRGDTISIYTGTVYETKQFRVISITNTIAKISIVDNDKRFNARLDDTSRNAYYEGSSADKGMVNLLRLYFSSSFQNACVEQTFTQKNYGSYSSSASTRYKWERKDGTMQYLSNVLSNFSHDITRKIRIIGIDDIIEFFGATPNMGSDNPLTYNNITNMLFGTITPSATYGFWMLNASSLTKGVSFSPSTGQLSETPNISNNYGVVPVFYIDLTKIPFTIITPPNT